jgi:hypothetical protein
MTDAEFDALHGGRELLPIEQVAYEAEGAERFAKFHGHGRTFPRQAEHDVEQWVSKLNRLARSMDDSASGVHPDVAFEQSKDQRDAWKRLAAATTKEPS